MQTCTTLNRVSAQPNQVLKRDFSTGDTHRPKKHRKRRFSASLTVRRQLRTGCSGATSHSWDGVYQRQRAPRAATGLRAVGVQSETPLTAAPGGLLRGTVRRPVPRSHFWAPSQEPKQRPEGLFVPVGPQQMRGWREAAQEPDEGEWINQARQTQAHTRTRAHAGHAHARTRLCAHTHTHAHTRTHAYVRTRLCARTHTPMRTHAHTPMRTRTRVAHAYVHTRARLCAHARAHAAHARTHTVECYLTNLRRELWTQAVMRTSLADVRGGGVREPGPEDECRQPRSGPGIKARGWWSGGARGSGGGGVQRLSGHSAFGKRRSRPEVLWWRVAAPHCSKPTPQKHTERG